MKEKFLKIFTNVSYWFEKNLSKYDTTNLLYLFGFGWLVSIMTSFIAALIVFAVITFGFMIKEKCSLQTVKNDNVRFAIIGGFISLIIRLIF